MRDGIRIGGMGIQAEFGYRSAFQSSVHPICLPLNLSEVYVLFDALAEYVHEKDGQDPHRKTAERLAGMVKSQLSDYAKERLQVRLEEMGFDGLEEVAPLFALDSPSGNARGREGGPLTLDALREDGGSRGGRARRWQLGDRHHPVGRGGTEVHRGARCQTQGQASVPHRAPCG